MRKLLSAGFGRLWRNKFFYLAIVGIFLLAVVTVLNGCRQAINDTSGYIRNLEWYYFDTAVYSGIFLSAFIALFIGAEHSDRTLHNKLIVGHSRTEVYLANLTICSTVTVFLVAAWMLGGMVGIPVLGFWIIGVRGMLLATLVSVLVMVSLSSIFLMVSMLSSSKAVTAVTCILLSLLLIVCATTPYNALCQPEMSSGVMITVEGGLQFMDPTPNPGYVGEPLRSVYTVIVNMLPTGQQILLANIISDEGFANYLLQIIGSVLITAFTTGVGISLFRRKDLK